MWAWRERQDRPQDGEPGLVLTLLASAPLLLSINDARHGLILGLTATLALCVCGLLVNVFHHLVPVSLRFALLLVCAGAVGSAASLLLAALAWETWLALRPALPFLLFNSLVFSCLEQDCLGTSVRRAAARLLRVACGLFFLYSLYGLVIGALWPRGLSPAALLLLLASTIVLLRSLRRPSGPGADAQ